MDESEFEIKASHLLRDLVAHFENLLPDAEVDFEGGVLTVELEDGRQYVLNKHAPTKQIWLSSPVSGASHYVFDESSVSWKNTRGGDDLLALLNEEIG
jgi:frataxin